MCVSTYILMGFVYISCSVTLIVSGQAVHYFVEVTFDISDVEVESRHVVYPLSLTRGHV